MDFTQRMHELFILGLTELGKEYNIPDFDTIVYLQQNKNETGYHINIPEHISEEVRKKISLLFDKIEFLRHS